MFRITARKLDPRFKDRIPCSKKTVHRNLKRIMPLPRLHRNPPHLRKRIHTPLPTKPPIPRRTDPAKRHLRFVVDLASEASVNKGA